MFLLFLFPYFNARVGITGNMRGIYNSGKERVVHGYNVAYGYPFIVRNVELDSVNS